MWEAVVGSIRRWPFSSMSATASAASSNRTAPAGGGALSVRAVEVGYGGASRVLHGVSLKVGSGQAVALLGTNGAGKTTTIRTISGLLGRHHGRVLAGEVEFATKPPRP